MDQADLTPEQAEAVVKALRVGATATEAAAAAGAKPAAVYAAARTDTDLLLALAGHDPYAYDAERLLQQADYIRLLALGFKPTQAARVLFHGDERAKGWRQQNSTFGRVADYVRRLNPPQLLQRREQRFTPYRVKVFLEAMRSGMTAVMASEEAGITNAVIYQRRRRDEQFRQAMDAARAEGMPLRHRRRPAVEDEQWVQFERKVRDGMTLRVAATRAGIPAQIVYERRHADEEFRRATDRWRGVPGAGVA